MRAKQFFFTLFLFSVYFSSTAQVTLTGIVIDAERKTALPFVNIGIKHKNIGTCTILNGTFSIQIPNENVYDTLTFSMVGYSELNIQVRNIINYNQNSFKLRKKVTELNEVSVTASKLTEKKIGITNTGGLLHLMDGSTNQNDIFEIAQLIKQDATLSKITSVNLFINESREDSGIFRINFYGFDGVRPTERIVEKRIVHQRSIREGWMKFDLDKYNIYLKGNFVVAIEFIPTDKKSSPIRYEVKIGGSSKSFVRKSSQGDWDIPPHHYRLFVTVLESEMKNKSTQNDSENKETIPTTKIFSESVRDTFALFINLPKYKNTKKNQKLPVIFLLDANVYFDLVANAMKENKTNAILVGIGYKDFLTMDSLRNRDYTFPDALPDDSFPISGGADKFLSFISNELIPYISNKYPIDTNKMTLMGHSLGGYFILYALDQALQKNKNIFKNYVAASPSLDYCNNYLLKQFQDISTGNKNEKQSLLLTIGDKEDSEDGGTGTKEIDNFNLFAKTLSGRRFENIKLTYKIYQGYGHMETAVPTFTKGIK